jgi:hypothetical protein
LYTHTHTHTHTHSLTHPHALNAVVLLHAHVKPLTLDPYATLVAQEVSERGSGLGVVPKICDLQRRFPICGAIYF